MKKFAGILLIWGIILALFASCAPNGAQSSTQFSNSESQEGDSTPSAPTLSEGLKYELNADEKSYSVIGFGSWEGTELVIPSEYNGLPVTTIGEQAFCNEYYFIPISSANDIENRQRSVMITSAVIPDSVTTIGAYSFLDCFLLRDITIPNSVQTIGAGAFCGCNSLSNITIPNSIQTIEAGAFWACRSLVNIHIPASVNSIGEGAFTGCTSLEKIEVDKDNQQYTSIANNLYSKNGKKLIQYALGQKAKTFTIPDSVDTIEAGAFSYCNILREITLSATMTKIESFAFSYCHSLSKINISASVKSIEDSAFMACYSLTSITIPESVAYISSNAFDQCPSLLEICNKSSANIGLDCHIITDESDSYIKNVNDFVFYDDGSNVYLIKYVGEGTKITLPQYGDSIPYGIYDYAFFDTQRDYRAPIMLQMLAGGNSRITSVTIPDYVVSIGNYAFSGCALLEELAIPSSVTTIGEYAFNGCSSLKSVIIPSSVTTIGGYAFNECSSLTLYCEAKSRLAGWDSTWNVCWPYFHHTIFVPTFWGGYINK